MANEKAKKVNYTEEQEKTLRDMYIAGQSVDTIAGTVGKTAKSVVAKLVRMGIYNPKKYVTKTGEAPVKKDQTADAIGSILGLSENEADSLAKANKTALQKVLAALLSAAKATAAVGPDAEAQVSAAVEAAGN